MAETENESENMGDVGMVENSALSEEKEKESVVEDEVVKQDVCFLEDDCDQEEKKEEIQGKESHDFFVGRMYKKLRKV